MEEEHKSSTSQPPSRLLLAVLSLPWVEMLAEGWKMTRKMWRIGAEEGMYEVLDYEATLELLDNKGEHARVRKRQKVRYLQNNIIAYQDQAWGDGEILLNYKCTPGVAVDRYRLDKKTIILISLHEVKNRGDEDEFNISWETKHVFTRPTELWSAEVSHLTRKFRLKVIFPATRPPIRASLVEVSTQKATHLSSETIHRLPDNRHEVVWEIDNPRRYETYALRWDW